MIDSLKKRSSCGATRIPFPDYDSEGTPLGANLEGIVYFMGFCPFANLMLTAGDWKTPSNTVYAGAIDSNGWPTTLNGDTYIQTVVSGLVGTYGQGVILHEGVGTIALAGTVATNLQAAGTGRYTFTLSQPASASDWIYFRLTAINAGDPIRNIKIIMPGREAYYQDDVWNPNFLDLARRFKAVRFMDWMYTNESITVFSGTALTAAANTITFDTDASAVDDFYNGMPFNPISSDQSPFGINDARIITDYDGTTRVATFSGAAFAGSGHTNIHVYIYNTIQRDWADRMPTTYWSFGTYSAPWYRRSIPIEYLVDLCNRLQVDGWFCVPTAATDDYVTSLATYMAANLDTNLKAYIEYSNETWNGVFAFSWLWCLGNGMNESLSAALLQAGDYWFSKRTVEIANLFSTAFSEAPLRADRTSSRLYRVMGGRGPIAAENATRLDYVTGGHAAHLYVDGFSGAYYWSENNVTIDTLQRTGACTGGGADTVTVPSTGHAWSSVTNFFIGRTIQLIDVDGVTVLEERVCSAYNGTTKVLTVSSPWDNPPESGDLVRVLSLSIAELLVKLDENQDSRAAQCIDANNVVANDREILYWMYEGGVVFAVGNFLPYSDPANVTLTELSSDPGLGPLMLAAFERWRDGGDYASTQFIFTLTSPPGPFGREGFLETADSDPEEAYKLQACYDFMGTVGDIDFADRAQLCGQYRGTLVAAEGAEPSSEFDPFRQSPYKQALSLGVYD